MTDYQKLENVTGGDLQIGDFWVHKHAEPTATDRGTVIEIRTNPTNGLLEITGEGNLGGTLHHTRPDQTWNNTSYDFYRPIEYPSDAEITGAVQDVKSWISPKK